MKLTDPIVVKIGTPPAIVQRDTRRAEAVVGEVINLDRTIIRNQFDLGDLFVEFVDGQYFFTDGCATLSEFLRKHKFDVSERTVNYRVKASRYRVRLDLTREQLIAAGTSKVDKIFELNPDLEHTDESTGNVEKMSDIMRKLVIDAGSGMKLKEVKKIVDDLKGATEGEDSVLVWFNLPVFRDRQEFFEETIEMAIQESGDTVDQNGEVKDISRATAVERIFAEARSGFGLESSDVGEQGTFQDETAVEEDNEHNED